ncbi:MULTISPECIES: LysR family transcriptional regulator [unclassified Hahella]|uniref:LysR family transcriptional regulator n=1 Tax=unclassified Hahella TaxID=2624107 RepID=UPI001C1EF765|nr:MULTISPECIES: LysR family transcriptional regulator [unclassified Hahella]MBU6954894.1 LysR family transcriptional regulator [Hahella sp. HN01]MDG9669690.1 LysR family transcriptional regulator [Hahella sp. CR1]
MTNEQLRAFVGVVEHGSFRAAAAALFKTQSTVSAAVAALEQEFDLQLFSRETYRPTLTIEGKALFREAKALLSKAHDLEMLGHRLAQGKAPELSISLSAMCAHLPGLDTLKAFAKKRPEMRLHLHTEHLSGVLEQLLVEKAEVAIGPQVGLDDRYEFTEVAKVTQVTVAAPGFVEAGADGVVRHAQLRNLPHILIADSGSLAPFDHVNVIPGGHRWYVNDFLMKKGLLLSGMGWARIPLHMVDAELEREELRFLQVENFPSRSLVPIYLIRLRNQLLSPLAQEFWDEMLGASL